MTAKRHDGHDFCPRFPRALVPARARRDTMAFYHPRCIDPAGGFFQYFRDDGTIYDAGTVIWSAARGSSSTTPWPIGNSATTRVPGGRAPRPALPARRAPRTGTTADTPGPSATAGPRTAPITATAAPSCCSPMPSRSRPASTTQAGWLDETWDLLEARFWDAEAGLYRDEATPTGCSRRTADRTPTCTCARRCWPPSRPAGERRYLDRALLLADHMTPPGRRPPTAWSGSTTMPTGTSDWDYNRDNPQAPVPPVGLPARAPDRMGKAAADAGPPCRSRLVASGGAASVRDRAGAAAWDDEHGGIFYGFAPDGTVCDGDKYFWVQAETLAAAALLAAHTGDDGCWNWYERIWRYAWAHFVDHEYGAWYRILDRRKPKIQRREKPGRQDRLPHDGRLLRSAQCGR